MWIYLAKNNFKEVDMRVRCTEKDQADLKGMIAKYGWKSYGVALRHLMLYYEGLETRSPIKTFGLEVSARLK